MAEVTGLWRSPRRGLEMERLQVAQAVEKCGIEGCAHARTDGSRQVLFADSQDLRDVGVEPGRIRENVTVEGGNVMAWPIGQRVQIGEAEFEIAMVCDPCERMDELRPGLQRELEGKRGMLGRVLRSGELAIGDPVVLAEPDNSER